MATAKKIGRPKKPPAKSLGILIALRLLPREARAYRRAAEAKKQSLSDWIRTTLRKAVPDELENLGGRK